MEDREEFSLCRSTLWLERRPSIVGQRLIVVTEHDFSAVARIIEDHLRSISLDHRGDLIQRMRPLATATSEWPSQGGHHYSVEPTARLCGLSPAPLGEWPFIRDPWRVVSYSLAFDVCEVEGTNRRRSRLRMQLGLPRGPDLTA
jgi:hypothetical protein